MARRLQPPALPGPETLLQVRRLPARIRQMVQIILEQQELICQADIGSLELHFYRDTKTSSVKPKLVLNLTPATPEPPRHPSGPLAAVLRDVFEPPGP